MHREAKNLTQISYKYLISATFGNVQMLLAENHIKWSAADEVCIDMFSGSHLATEILEGSPDYNLIALENFHGKVCGCKTFNL